MSAFKELIRRVKAEVREVSVEEARALLPSAALLDVREGDEWVQGHLPGALHIPRGFLELKVEEALPDKSKPVVVYCAGGTRSALAARTLADLGYGEVVSLAGGFSRWKEAGSPVVMPKSLKGEQQERYSRHVKVPEVGEAGQLKLLDSKVLIVGAGGLGSPAAFYLAAAGVGTIGLVDFDRVDRSNLQRQILHTEASVGQPKTESAQARLQALNPDVKVVRHDVRLEAGNAQEVLGPYDVILDGCDNFSTKYLVNDAAVLLGKPNVYGSIYRFEGQMSSFVPGQGPCYRCLYPEPTPSELAPSCDEAGVLGVLPGVVGLIQATEVVKLLLGIGEPLVGRLLTYDALSMKFREFKVRRDPACALCGDKPTIRNLEDLVWSCHLGARPAEVGGVNTAALAPAPVLGSILQAIGRTPLVRLSLPGLPAGVELLGKCEWFNPGGSVKDRTALSLVSEGERSGALRPGKTIIDSSSGNTAVGLALVGRARGYPVELVMPQSVSAERQRLCRAYGARLVFTDAFSGSDGALLQVRQLVAADPEKYFYADQYRSPANPLAHYRTTGPEIWEQTEGGLTHFVAGLGTSGTIVGTGRYLHERDPGVRVVAVEPAEELHGLEGLKHMPTAIVPEVYDPGVEDAKIRVVTDDAEAMCREALERCGLFLGHSAGAALWAAREVARGLASGVVVALFPDGGERYL